MVTFKTNHVYNQMKKEIHGSFIWNQTCLCSKHSMLAMFSKLLLKIQPGMVALTVNSSSPVGKQRQENLCEFEASLFCIESFRPPIATKTLFKRRKKILMTFFIMMVIVFKNKLLKL